MGVRHKIVDRSCTTLTTITYYNTTKTEENTKITPVIAQSSMPMKLSKQQVNLLKSLSTNYTEGLPHAPLSADVQDESEFNIIPPPLNCPKWACIILPCINHVPSMKLFKVIQPTEAETLKKSKWIVYDAVSICKGDIIRLNDGDIVPADAVVLSLGMDFIHVPTEEDEGDEDKTTGKEDRGLFVEDLVVDSSNVNGYVKPQTISVETLNGAVHDVQLYAGSMILQGCCIAVVTNIGSETLLGSLIKKGKWPPKEHIDLEQDGEGTTSLVQESEVI